MTFTEFLSLVKVLKMLYGRDFADNFFTNNIDLYYDLDSASLNKQKSE